MEKNRVLRTTRMLALTLVVGLSMVGCSKKNAVTQSSGGVTYCSDPGNPNAIVSAYLYVRRAPSNLGNIEFDYIIESVVAAGVNTGIAFLTPSNEARIVESFIQLNAGDENFLGTFSASEYARYSTILFYSPCANSDPLTCPDPAEISIVCEMPQLGDGLGS